MWRVMLLVTLQATANRGFHRTVNHSGLVILEERDLMSAFPTRSSEQAFQLPQYQADQNLCPSNTVCSTLSECRLLLGLMDRSCLIPSRLRDLTCGYRRSEPMVCCPRGGTTNPWSDKSDTSDGGSGGHDGQGGQGTRPGLNRDCGRPQLNGWKNGYSGLGSQPWVARIGFKNSETGSTDYPCCGSIITNKVVLTAAHCALAKSEGHSLTSVRVGEYDMRSNPDCTDSFCAHPMQNIDVSHVVVHPGFERATFRHDMAMVVLKVPMNYSLGVQPICLMHDLNTVLVGQTAKLIGWGKLPGQDVVPPTVQQLDLPVVHLNNCSTIFGRIIPITSNQLCVGGELKKDACSGFGGAPLVILDPIMKDKYYQVGMVSFGSDRCGAKGVPSVYTNIRLYYEWIANNIEGRAA